MWYGLLLLITKSLGFIGRLHFWQKLTLGRLIALSVEDGPGLSPGLNIGPSGTPGGLGIPGGPEGNPCGTPGGILGTPGRKPDSCGIPGGPDCPPVI